MRPALIEQDAKTAPLFNAKGESLGFNLGAWLGVKGVVIIGPLPDGKATIFAQLTHLRPGGYYSLFENHFDQQPIAYTPLDGSGKGNNFIASRSGSARVALTAAQMLTHVNRHRPTRQY